MYSYRLALTFYYISIKIIQPDFRAAFGPFRASARFGNIF